MTWVQWWCTGVMLDRIFVWPHARHDGPYDRSATQEMVGKETMRSISLDTGKAIDYTV